MDVKSLIIPDVKLVTPKRFGDSRGFFQESYLAERYKAEGITADFVQDNWSRSSRGTLRGLHFQRGCEQAKLVSVIRGEVFDVAVDLRADSPTYGKWVGEILTEENGCQLYVPRGFAHGFLVLSEFADFVYKCDEIYCPEADAGVRWNDPAIGIEWPMKDGLLLSEKDEKQPLLSEIEPLTLK